MPGKAHHGPGGPVIGQVPSVSAAITSTHGELSMYHEGSTDAANGGEQDNDPKKEKTNRFWDFVAKNVVY